VVATGLQCHIEGRAARPVSRRAQGHDLRVRAARRVRRAFAHDDAIAHEHGSDGRVGAGAAQDSARQLEHPRPPVSVVSYIHESRRHLPHLAPPTALGVMVPAPLSYTVKGRIGRRPALTTPTTSDIQPCEVTCG